MPYYSLGTTPLENKNWNFLMLSLASHSLSLSESLKRGENMDPTRRKIFGATAGKGSRNTTI
jgi:hypothetical protein